MHVLKYSLVTICLLFAKLTYAEPAFVCSADKRPADGDYFEFQLHKGSDGLFELYQSFAMGGYSPYPKPKPVENELVASNLSCDVYLSEDVLARCDQADGSGFLEVERIDEPYLQHLFSVKADGRIIGYVEREDCSANR